ncbi:TIGR02452 family protein, partial [Streptomyces heliomycini]
MFPGGSPPVPRAFRGGGNSVAARHQHRSGCPHEHDERDRAVRGHGGYGGGAVSAPARHRPRDERSAAGADGGAPVPGGGHPNGAQAQEEALCRAFALCTCLPRTAGFHDRHRARRDPFRAGRVVHSPAVPVFRDDRGRPLDEPFTAGFPTSPAPHAGVIPRTAPQRAVEEPHAPAVRAGRVPETAAAHGCRRLVPGARGRG